MISILNKKSGVIFQIHVFLTCLLLCLSITPQSTAMENERYTSVNIIPERTHDIKAGDTITIATEVILEPEWHVYWRNPGDSGLPVSINWNAPEGFIFGEIQWPTPDKISYEILANYGYYNKVIFLQNIIIPISYMSGEFNLDASIDMLVCNEICIPEASKLRVTLNDPNAPIQDNSATIKAAQEKMPQPLHGSFKFHENQENLHLLLNTDQKNTMADSLEFFPYDWGVLQYTADAVKVKTDDDIQLIYPRGDRSLAELTSLDGLLVLTGEKGENISYEISASPNSFSPQAPLKKAQAETLNKHQQTSPLTWASAIGLALLGGLILNLMPCVFPVLSMKALSLIKMGEKEKKHARTYGISYALGVVLSFVIIGLLLVLLQQAGSAIGWGFQLQNPIIITLLAYLLFTIGLNLMGFFEFRNALGNVGNKMTKGSSAVSSFFTGTLVTFVAAPCIGPFLGAAMGYAIIQPAVFSIIFFASLGLGLAAPYLILSFVPASRTLLPKPGAWMNSFKQALSFPMFASAIVFVWVLSQQAGADAALSALTGMLLISFIVWLARYDIKRILILILIILSSGALAYTIYSIQKAALNQSPQPTAKTFGENFSKNALNEALKGNKPVFVEMTAAWCFTCKINHAIAINVNSTKTLFKQKNVKYFIGDWTNHDKSITDYLAQHGRNGVPLYVYYPPRKLKEKERTQPVILPQVLTPGIVQEVVGQ